MSHQVGVVVTGIVRHLVAHPGGLFDFLILGLELALGHYESLVLTVEFIHFPDQTAISDLVTGLFDQRPFTKVQQLIGVLYGNIVLEFLTGGSF